MKITALIALAAALAWAGAQAAVLVEVGANNPSHTFPTLPPPSNADLGQSGTLSVVEGALNGNSGPVTVLNNGLAQDSVIDCCDIAPLPNGSAWIAEGTSGKIRLSFDAPKEINAVRTYSWFELAGQNNARAGQKYRLYGSAAAAPGVTDADLAGPDWSLLATVDSDAVTGTGASRPAQIASAVSAGGAALGTFRHLLWDIDPVDGIGTFYGEFDVIAQATYAELVLTDNPIHYYPLNETSGTTAEDLGSLATAGGIYTGGITLGRPTTPLLLGNAAHFDGVDGSFVDLGLFHPGDSVTLEAWVNADLDASATFKAIIARWDGSYEMDWNPQDIANLVIRNDANAFGIVASQAPLARGQWHHLVSIFHDGTLTIYVNGVQGTSQSIGGVLQNAGPSPDRVLIGATRSGIFGWKGLIDEVAVYDYALPPERIAVHYNAAIPAAPPELAIQKAVLLTWPAFPPGYRLQASANVAGPYEDVAEQPRVEGGIAALTVVLGPQQKFYRLFKP